MITVTVGVENDLHVLDIEAQLRQGLDDKRRILDISRIDKNKSVTRVDKMRGCLERTDKIKVSDHSEGCHFCKIYSHFNSPFPFALLPYL